MQARKPNTHMFVAGAIAVVGVAIALFVVRAGAAFGPMYAELVGTLPRPTRILFAWWAPVCAGAIVACPAILALARTRAQWLALAASGALALLLGAATLWAAYAPLYELAGNLQAE